MARCQHKNLTLIEDVEAAWIYVFDDGALVDYGMGETPNHTGMFEAECRDCGLIYRGSQFSKTTPKWFKKAIDRATVHRLEPLI